ncbi:MAG: hypothetical protein CL920_23155 [Deltaproteobacteria bacterium]|nr:hypothetical protein [Deltaproteobacteria bacterium]MBU51601.1 hypothetical protein [Deltaproteobacteria bacterium]|tara:strand:+ start:15034 stop:17439 length:2406 start_codon:yes stop_codon:yes gene_type:complete
MLSLAWICGKPNAILNRRIDARFSFFDLNPWVNEMDASSFACPQCQYENQEGHRYCPSCRFPLAVIANKYKLTQAIAEGGFGTVYRAEHILLEEEKDRVIKVMKPEVMNLPGMRTRFFREVRITSSLSQRNEHIVRIYDDFGEDDVLGFYYVMEFLRGEPLSHELLRHERLPLQRVLYIFAQMCKAIGEAHRADIIHRDLKPDNIVLIHRHEHPDFVKVLDFGIAKPLGDNSQPNLTQGMIGTPAYMSPEQCMGKDIGPETDIYASGIILYELLHGTPPFTAPEEATGSSHSFMSILHSHIQHEPPSLRRFHPEIPQGVEDAIMKSLEKSPTKRYASMDEFRAALAPFWDSSIISADSKLWSRALGTPVSGVPVSTPAESAAPPSNPGLLQLSASTPQSAQTQTFSGGEELLSDPGKLSGLIEELREIPIVQKKPSKKPMFLGAFVLLLLLLVGGGYVFTDGFRMTGFGAGDGSTVPAQRPEVERREPPPRKQEPAPKEKPVQVADAAVMPEPEPAPVRRRIRPRRRVVKRRIVRRRRVVRRRMVLVRRRKAPSVRRRMAVVRRVAPPIRAVAIKVPPRRDDMPMRPPPRDRMPTRPPPIKRKQSDSVETAYKEFMLVGKKLARAVRNRSRQGKKRFSLQLFRMSKNPLLRKLPPKKLIRFKRYRAFAAYHLVIPYRAYFMRLGAYGRHDGEIKKSIKKAVYYHSRYQRMIRRLRVEPNTQYYLCSFYYDGEARVHLAEAFRAAADMVRAPFLRRRYTRRARQLSRRARNIYRKGLGKRVRRRQICRTHLKSAYRNFRGFR